MLRVTAQRAGARARRVKHDRLRERRPLLRQEALQCGVVGGIVRVRRDAAELQPLARLLDELQLPFVALDRDERSAIPHELRQVCRLAPRGRAQVEDRLTGGRRGEQRDELRCHVLHAPRAARKPYRTRGYMGRPAVKESEGRRGRRRGGEGDSRGRGGRGGGPAGAQGLGRPNVGVPGSCGTAPPPEGRSSAPGTSPTRSATMPAALISASTVSTSATSGLTRIASAGRSWCARAHASSSSKSCRCVARSSASSQSGIEVETASAASRDSS
mmetsp:Transcript_6245/g.16400  ORF Transcript_6245/g.16400 Transcript_6245/m.16400 type:complete len:272 (-) Transcript_6245:79-894(-)